MTGIVPDGASEARWFAEDEVRAMMARNEILDGMSVTALLQRADAHIAHRVAYCASARWWYFFYLSRRQG